MKYIYRNLYHIRAVFTNQNQRDITLANHKGHSHYSEPIKARSNYMQLTQSVGKRV